MDLCAQVAEYKIKNGKSVFDKEREEQKFAAVSALAHNAFNARGVRELFEQLVSMSRKLQYQIIARP